MVVLERIRDFILKDVKNQNETKKTAICLRVNAIIMSCYFLCLLGVFYTQTNQTMTIACGLCFAANAMAFAMTYQSRTRISLLTTLVTTVVWVILSVCEMGWQSEAQNFLVVLLWLIFAPSFITISTKMLHSVLVFLIYVLLFFFASKEGLLSGISPQITLFFEFVNCFFVFITLVVELLLFTHDSAKMEQKLMKYNKRLHKMALEDPLTGLPNRRSIMNALQKYRSVHPLELGPCVAIADLDFFKKINDTYGHEAGDEVLKAAAKVFAAFMNGKGMIGRWGGEEFLFVFTNCNLDHANVYLSDLLAQVREIKVPYKDQVIRLTMTVGVEECGAEDVEKTIKAADAKLYMGKEDGRNRVVC